VWCWSILNIIFTNWKIICFDSKKDLHKTA
jgi:hypothetical protein